MPRGRYVHNRWPKAMVRISDGTNTQIDSVPGFISITYASKVPSGDIDMDAWAESVPLSQAGNLPLHLDSSMPTKPAFARQISRPTEPRCPLRALPDLLKWVKIPQEYDDLAKTAAKNAARLSGLTSYDRLIASFPKQTKAKRLKFKKALAVALDNLIHCLPRVKRPNPLELAEQLGFGNIAHENTSHSTLALFGIARRAVEDSFETFARAYVECAIGIAGVGSQRPPVA